MEKRQVTVTPKIISQDLQILMSNIIRLDNDISELRNSIEN